MYFDIKESASEEELTEEQLCLSDKTRVSDKNMVQRADYKNFEGFPTLVEESKPNLLATIMPSQDDISLSALNNDSSGAETEKMDQDNDLDDIKLSDLSNQMEDELRKERRDKDNCIPKRIIDEITEDKKELPLESSGKFKKPKLPLKQNHQQTTHEEEELEGDEDNEEEEEEEEGDGEEEDRKIIHNHTRGDDKSPMEQEKLRQDALKEIIEIEHQFANLRQRLYENKIAKLQMELKMCLDGSHPDLQSYYGKIDHIRDCKLKKAYQRQKYELECIDKETRATRTFIHQNFYRQISDLKHQLLNETTQKWYDINKERREMDVVVPEVNYHVPVKIGGKTLSCITGYASPAQARREGDFLPEDLEYEGIQFRFKTNPVDKLEVIVDRMRFNNELSDLQGLKKYFAAFPGAPRLNGLKEPEIYEDLQNARSMEDSCT